MRNIPLYLFAAATLVLGVVACKKEPQPNNPVVNPGEFVTELNGTAIAENSNIIGVVSDNTGKPIKGVKVSDGYNIVLTDANGVYQMEGSRYARKAYITVPSGYEVPLDPVNHLPLFYSPGTIVRANQNRNDFVLTPLTTSEDKITLVMISDPQCQSVSNVSRYKDETVTNIAATLGSLESKYPNPYAYTLGDIVFDSSVLWPNMKESMSNVKYGSGKYLPFFQTIGNHDHYSKASDDYTATENYFNNFGPTDYSLDRGNVHIIAMDDIMVTSPTANSSPDKATWSYNGGFTPQQMKWLTQDIELCENRDQKMVVLCLHIPFRGGSSSGGSNVNTDKNYKEVLNLLKTFKEAHIMIGHTHYPQNYIHTGYLCKSGLPIYEHVHGAACGGWWSCNSNVNGTPNGYYLYEVDTKNATMIDWTLKPTAQDFSFQLRVYDGNELYTGTRGYVYDWTTTSNGGAGKHNVGGSANIFATGNAKFKNAFIAEVFNDDGKYWKVELWQNGAKVADMQRLPDGSSCNVCVTSYFFNELGKNTSTWTTKTASHYWYYVPESKTPGSEKNWEVRAIQKLPNGGMEHTYTCDTFTVDYSSF